VLDPASNTFRVRLALPNPDLRIPAGARCKVDFGLDAQVFAPARPRDPAGAPAAAAGAPPARPPLPPPRVEASPRPSVAAAPGASSAPPPR
jgi:hypothetical protein